MRITERVRRVGFMDTKNIAPWTPAPAGGRFETASPRRATQAERSCCKCGRSRSGTVQADLPNQLKTLLQTEPLVLYPSEISGNCGERRLSCHRERQKHRPDRRRGDSDLSRLAPERRRQPKLAVHRGSLPFGSQLRKLTNCGHSTFRLFLRSAYRQYRSESASPVSWTSILDISPFPPEPLTSKSKSTSRL